MARMVAVSLIRPCFQIQSRSAPSAGWCGRESVTSPPSSASPWRSKLARRASASAPTPVMTATPSATQAMKT